MIISRSIAEPIRQGLSQNDRWCQADNGLIYCWERGREKSEKEPELAARAKAGELVVLPWKGGIERQLKKATQKTGTHFYLAMWQGLRGESLAIERNAEIVIICKKFGIAVKFTGDISTYAKEDI